jgi:CBS domain-containing protein
MSKNEENILGVLMSQKLKKIMAEKVITIEPIATVKRAAELMNANEIGCLIVVDRDKPLGIVTERDMLKRVICGSRGYKTTIIRDIMSKPLITASANMHAGDAAKLMLERNIKKLPVVENGRLEGLVTLTDLLRSSGVIEYLSRLSLDGTSRRIKRAVNLYYDQMKMHRRRCPMFMKDGFSMGCLVEKCMWWVGDDCAVTKLSQLIAANMLLEADIT